MRGARDIWAVVPFKGLDRAKQRLAPAFSPAFRRELSRAMLEDVIDVLLNVPELAGVVLVTGDPEAMAVARARGVRVFEETVADGLTAAVMAAANRLERDGRGGMLVVPADVPGITAHEISHLLAAHHEGQAFTIVPAHDRRGTNAIVVTPPAAVTLAYGADSFAVHLERARQAGLIPTVLSLPGLALDVDMPADCEALLRQGRGAKTLACLRRQAEAIEQGRDRFDA